MDDLIRHHHDQTADALATVAIRLRETADTIDRLVAMSPSHRRIDEGLAWTPAVVRTIHEIRSLVGNLGALDVAIENAAAFDRLVQS